MEIVNFVLGFLAALSFLVFRLYTDNIELVLICVLLFVSVFVLWILLNHYDLLCTFMSELLFAVRTVFTSTFNRIFN